MENIKIVKVTYLALYLFMILTNCESVTKDANVPYTTRIENCMSETRVAVDIVDEFREGGFMSNDEAFKVFSNYWTKALTLGSSRSVVGPFHIYLMVKGLMNT